MVSSEVCKRTWPPWSISGTLCVYLTPGKADEVLGSVGGRGVADYNLCSIWGEGADTRVDDCRRVVKVRDSEKLGDSKEEQGVDKDIRVVESANWGRNGEGNCFEARLPLQGHELRSLERMNEGYAQLQTVGLGRRL